MDLHLEQVLNGEQLAAVTAPDGPVLVIAAAGTGKTRTLTYRMAWLVCERGVDPWNILLLTFTNRAAREMLDRAARLIGEMEGNTWGGTFHHVACRMLRQHAERIGFETNFSILDQDDATRLVKACMAEKGYKAKKPAGKKALARLEEDDGDGEGGAVGGSREKDVPKAEVMGSIFDLAASRMEDVRKVAEERLDPDRLDIDAVVAVHELYTLRKREQNVMDFNDLLSNALRLLREAPDVGEGYRRRFRHVLVDEFQDTNRVQVAFLEALTGENGNLYAVGDDFQSIYSWRGAEVRNILEFEKRHPGATVYKLTENYRSRPGVLEVANRVIGEAQGQIAKTLKPFRRDAGGEDPAVLLARLGDGGHQARYVAAKIRSMLQRGEASPGEIAVLYRSHFLVMEMEMELTRQDVPYALLSGQRFFEQQHIKDVCALPLLLANPRDGGAFMRLMMLLPGVGEKKSQAVWLKLGGRANLREAAVRDLVGKSLPPQGRAAWEETWRKMLPAGPEKQEAFFASATELIGGFTRAYYGAYAEVSFEKAAERLQDVEELAEYAGRFTDLSQFLGEMALMTNLEADQDRNARMPADAVRLTTVHQAKGLEWKVVFLLWANEGLFPSAKSLEDGKGDAEERRLFYVAVTRAKDRLFLCVPGARRSRSGEYTLLEDSHFIRRMVEDRMLPEAGDVYATRFAQGRPFQQRPGGGFRRW
jgi:DNA helicase-2/ATP-dependent DNA helicase PcrA